MTEAVLVMLNNYFHDLAVAFLFASGLMAWVVLEQWPGRPSERVGRLLSRVAWGSLAWVLVGGAIRAFYYRRYEWMPEAGAAQVTALAGKHVLLFAVTVAGLVAVVRLRRKIRETEPR